jgi:hypothetical protein
MVDIKVVREVDSGRGMVPVSQHFDSFPDARRAVHEYGGVLWIRCESHGWQRGEYCRNCLVGRG